MARKDLLKDLMAGAAPETKSASPPPRYQKGAIGAVSKSIADLKNRSVVEIDPNLITGAGMEDRLEEDEDDQARLMASIKDHGQQVPILVRPHPEDAEKFQIVYGRRRVLAMRDLGLPIKAMIRDLDDTSLVMAQGQENNVRRDLSFIEKANFARQMTEAGYDRKAICDAVNVDKTVISRMLNIINTLSPDMIRLIGAAPSAGRDRWLELAGLWEGSERDLDLAASMISAQGAENSDERFRALLDWLKSRDKVQKAPKKKTGKPDTSVIKAANGKTIAHLKRTPTATTLTLKGKDSEGFDDWLAENLTELHRSWSTSREGGAK